MIEFSKYYINFIREFVGNIWSFIKNIFNALADILFRDIVEYFKAFIDSSGNFGIFDWLLFTFVTLINVAFIFFIILRLVQLVKRYVKFRRKQVEKEELIDEIAGLNYKIEELVNEKNQLFAMKVSNLGLKPAKYQELDEEAEEKPEVVEESGSRFVKLVEVDKRYEGGLLTVNMTANDMLSLPEITERFVNFAASQLNLYYDKKIVAVFFAGMATTKIIILEGISGTGKTSLPYAMGKFFENDSEIVSVQPSWRDRAEIIGYLNEFTKKFNETDFLKAIYETTYREDLNFIILDEMNLARIEYYFAEFLSIMEMPDESEWTIDIVPNEDPNDPKNFINGKILLPQNVWFIGTANKDDSTFTITDKVYDRAVVISMNNRAEYIDAPYTTSMRVSYEYMEELFSKALADHEIGLKSLDNIAKLDEFIMNNFKVTFGNRIMKQIKIFIPVFVACGFTEAEGLDYFIAYKVLRKFESINLSFLHKELEAFIAFLDRIYGKNTFKESISYIKELLKNS